MASVVSLIGLGLSAAGTASSRQTARKGRQDTRDAEGRAEKQIADQQKLEADEKRRAEEKVEKRQRAVTEEGRPSTFAAGGQGGLSNKAPTKKKKLGN